MKLEIKFKMYRTRSMLCFRPDPDVQIIVEDKRPCELSQDSPTARLFSFLQCRLWETPEGQLYGRNLYVRGHNSTVF